MRAPVRSRRGLTIVELVLALGLFALASVALVQLIDTTLNVWEAAERKREELGRDLALVEWFERDLSFLAVGEPGDLLFDWQTRDVNGDGIATRPGPRMRLVRQATAEDLDRLGARVPADPAGETARPPLEERPLIEVVWTLQTPENDPKLPAEGRGLLWRAEALLDAPGSFFESNAIARDGSLDLGEPLMIADDVLHWQVLFASQTSDLRNGWNTGSGLASVSTAWDARGQFRPDAEQHPLNEIAPGSPDYDGDPVLPRRVRLELELADRFGATLLKPLAADNTDALVRAGRDRPEEGQFALLGEEWVRVTQIDGERWTLVRGQRGTRAVAHLNGAPLDWGRRMVREFVVPQHVEDWDL